MKFTYPLWLTLRSLKGNQKALVVTEPLWSIPSVLFSPFASVYMIAIGLNGQQIGAIVSIGLGLQLLWGFFSGAIVDKYGRRRTMAIFGLLSWTIPCLLWAFAHNYPDFLVAAAFNSMWQVTGNGFACMVIEDGSQDSLVHIWTVINLMGLVAGFLVPIVGIFIAHFTLVPTMRVIYFGSMVLMTIRFVWLYFLSRETATGSARIKECQGRSILSLSLIGWPVFLAEIRKPRLLLSVLLIALLSCFSIVQTTFWPLFVTTSDRMSNAMLSVFPLVSSLVTLPIYLAVVPRITVRLAQRPLLIGLGLHAAAIVVLLGFESFRIGVLARVLISATCEASALAMLGPLLESMMGVVIPSEERARITSFIFAGVLLVSTPVGWIAGTLFRFHHAWPLELNFCLIIVGVIVSLLVVRTLNPRLDDGVRAIL